MTERILILGAGVIGSIYAARLANAGYDVTVLARSHRLAQIQQKGLLYFEKGKVCKAHIHVISELTPDDRYEFTLVAVQYEQIEAALASLQNSNVGNIVTMVNNPYGYEQWEKIVGTGRIIPAFPGAGGKIENGILYYRLTPYIIQPTTFGELSGDRTERINRLAAMMKKAHIPYSICANMDAWQKSHLAMVIPMANAIYLDGGNNYTAARNNKAIHSMTLSLRENFKSLKKAGIAIIPFKLNVFQICPIQMMDFILKAAYNTRFAETLISNHANNAKHEMMLLNNDFIILMESKGIELKNTIHVNWQ